ncbi:MAG: hypothetical protein CMJ32_09745 [Phycisphaerae bacterium]|nr:hypothetical protein [Phycisphaerae bacterium]
MDWSNNEALGILLADIYVNLLIHLLFCMRKQEVPSSTINQTTTGRPKIGGQPIEIVVSAGDER